MNERMLRVGAPVMVAMVLLGLWQAVVAWNDVPAWLIPSPARIGQTLWTDRALLLDSLGVTIGIALTALAIAIVAGVAIALLFAQSRLVEASLFPYAILLQVTPVVAIAPLIIIWVEDTRAALVLCAVVVAIFPIISNTTLGLRSVDPGLADLFRMSRASRWQTMLRLRIPSALPWFFAGLRIASGLALIGAVVAEFVAGTGGQARASRPEPTAGIERRGAALRGARRHHARRRRPRPRGSGLRNRTRALARERARAGIGTRRKGQTRGRRARPMGLTL